METKNKLSIKESLDEISKKSKKNASLKKSIEEHKKAILNEEIIHK